MIAKYFVWICKLKECIPILNDFLSYLGHFFKIENDGRTVAKKWEPLLPILQWQTWPPKINSLLCLQLSITDMMASNCTEEDFHFPTYVGDSLASLGLSSSTSHMQLVYSLQDLHGKLLFKLTFDLSFFFLFGEKDSRKFFKRNITFSAPNFSYCVHEHYCRVRYITVCYIKCTTSVRKRKEHTVEF